MLLKHLADIGNICSSVYFYIPVIVFGYFNLNKSIFTKASIIMIFSVILANYLKTIWQIPLPLGKEGWSFPSGHTMPFVCFFYWLAFEYRSKIFYLFSTIFIVFIAWALVYNNFHYISDVIGAYFFSIITLAIYYYLLKILNNKIELVGFLLSIAGIGLIYLIKKPTPTLWALEGGLIGFTLGWFGQNKLEFPKIEKKPIKLLLTALCLKGIFTIIIFKKLSLKLLPTYAEQIGFLNFFIMSLWVTFFTDFFFNYGVSIFYYLKTRFRK